MARGPGFLARWVVVAALLLPGLALASPASDALVEQAMSDPRAGRGDDAIAKLKQAAAADPRDATPPFLEGAVLNRLGRYDEALRRLQDSVLLGSTHTNLTFERGWALVGVQPPRDAFVTHPAPSSPP